MSMTVVDRESAADAVRRWITVYEEAQSIYDQLPVSTRAAIEASGADVTTGALAAFLATMPTSRRHGVIAELQRILEVLE